MTTKTEDEKAGRIFKEAAKVLRPPGPDPLLGVRRAVAAVEDSTLRAYLIVWLDVSLAEYRRRPLPSE